MWTILPGDDLAVVVTARTRTDLPGDPIRAFGCDDGISVVAQETTDVVIDLGDTEIPLDFRGVYDLESVLDLTGGLPPTIDEVIGALRELGDDQNTDGDGNASGQLCARSGPGNALCGQDPGAFILDVAARNALCAWECGPDESFGACRADPQNHPLGDLSYVYQSGFPDTATASLFEIDDIPLFGTIGTCTVVDLFKGAFQDQINTLIADTLGLQFLIDWSNLVSDVAAAIENAEIASTLNLTPTGTDGVYGVSHALERLIVEYRNPLSDPPGEVVTIELGLSEAGFAMRTEATADSHATAAGATLTIPEHTFVVEWGTLVVFVYRQLLPLVFGDDVTDTASLFTELVPCEGFDGFLVGLCDDVIADPCPSLIADLIRGEGEDPGLCETAVSTAGALLEGLLLDLIEGEGSLILDGTVTADAVDADTGRVQTLGRVPSPGTWDGVWGDAPAEGDAERGDIAGTFTGARR